MMTVHALPNQRGISVFDGKRAIAVARKTGRGPWILRVYNASWTDPRARTQGLFPGKYPYLMHVRTYKEALHHMTALANTGRKT